MNPSAIRFSRESMHDLRGLAARFSAILTLIEDPEESKSLDLKRVDEDFLDLLDKAQKIWRHERNISV